MRGSKDPRTPIHAAEGAIPKAKPSTRCDQRVKRLVYEYNNTTPSAMGDNMSARRFSCHAASTNTAQETMTKAATDPDVSVPAGRARLRVRGFAASMEASASRLKAMAAERAATMATMIQTV